MVCFGKRKVGDGEPCFITFEAGATHNGVETAGRLANYAKEAGADAVKFQIIDPDRLVADREMEFTYEVLADRETGRRETVSEPLYDILQRRYLSVEEWKQVKRHCDALGLSFFATAFFEEDIDLLLDMGCASVKIASADVNHWPLIRKAARTGMCIQLDTGNATLGEIEQAVNVCLEEGNGSIIIHNCPSGYPARLESINLNMIRTMKQMFPEFPVAYSDHTPGWEMDVAAVALGTNLVEKTITENRMTRSVEHIFSLEPKEMKSFIRTIREVETAMGKSRRVLLDEEIQNRQAVRRSAFLKRPVRKGESVAMEDVEFRRPGYGISPNEFEPLIDKKYSRDLDAGRRLSFSDMGGGCGK